MSEHSQNPPTTPTTPTATNPSTPPDLAQPDLSRVNPADLEVYNQELQSDKNAADRKRDAAKAAADDVYQAAESAWQVAERQYAAAERTASDTKHAALDAANVEYYTAKKELGKPGCEAPQKLRVLQEQLALKKLQAEQAEIVALAAAAAAKDTAAAALKAAETTRDFAKSKADAEHAVGIKTAETEYYKKISKAIG